MSFSDWLWHHHFPCLILLCSDVEAVAKLITNFLELNKVPAHQDFEDSSETDVTDGEEPKDK